MDEFLRELERRALSGDLVALERLRREWGRMGLIPLEEHIPLMMPCGFVKGRSIYNLDTREYEGDAVKIAMSIWTHLMRQLVEGSYRWRQNIISNEYGNDEIDLEEYNDLNNTIDEEYELLQQRLSSLKERVQPAEIYKLQTIGHSFARSLQEHVNQYLGQENMNLPDLYLHHNDVTRSVLMGFANTEVGVGTDAHQKLDSIMGLAAALDARPTKPSAKFVDELKLYVIIRRSVLITEDDGNKIYLDVEIAWNTGGNQPIPVFSELPACLREHPPGTWSEWGYGPCQRTYIGGGFTNYDPIEDEIDIEKGTSSRQWLHGL